MQLNAELSPFYTIYTYQMVLDTFHSLYSSQLIINSDIATFSDVECKISSNFEEFRVREFETIIPITSSTTSTTASTGMFLV